MSFLYNIQFQVEIMTQSLSTSLFLWIPNFSLLQSLYVFVAAAAAAVVVIIIVSKAFFFCLAEQ